MCGARDVYKYQLINEKGQIEHEGYARDLANKLCVVQNSIFINWKKGTKLLRKYKVERIKVRQANEMKNFAELYDLSLAELEFFDKTYSYKRNHNTKGQWDEIIRNKLKKKKEESHNE